MSDTQHCFDNWRTAFCAVITLMDAETNLSAASCIVELLDSEEEWTSIGAYDGRAFYNNIAGNAVKLKLCDNEDWMAKYFFLKYVEWTNPLAVS